MKSLNTLAASLLHNAGVLLGVDTTRDAVTLARRSLNEGDQFLTVTLPTFCAGFERAIADGWATPCHFPGFRCRGGFPVFLQGFLELVFVRGSGALRDDASASAVQAVRQLTLAFGKIFEVCPPDRVRASLDAYVACESEMEELWYDPRLLDQLSDVAVAAFGSHLACIDRQCFIGDLVPKHGPGATADRIKANAKYTVRYWTERLERVFPYQWYGSAKAGACSPPLIEPGAETPVRVIPVPKTASKARIIAIEPAAVQYCQQAVLGAFVSQFSGQAPFVDLTRQERNQELARVGSVDGGLSTIDLSEASDRVGLDVVRAVFRRFPSLLEALEASRSTSASVPGHGTIPVAKFASMGSATCFPVESIVFATAALLGCLRAANVPRRDWTRAIARLQSKVQVFGDDIIVPTDMTHSVLDVIARLGGRPNPRKSFWTGRFRESCGMEYYRGVDVTVRRLRRRLPSSRRDAEEISALVAFRNHLYSNGWWLTVATIDDWIRDLIPFPIVSESSQALGRHSVWLKPEVHRWDPDLQSPLVKAACRSDRVPRSPLDGWGALLKCTLPGRQEPFVDADHLKRSGRPDRATISIGWCPSL